MKIFLAIFLLFGLHQEDPVTLNQAGLERFQMFDFVGASREFQQALDKGSGSSIIKMNLLLAHFYAGSLDRTDIALHQILETENRNPYANFLAGLIASREGQFNEAAKHFEIVREVDPDDAGTLFQLGLIEFHEARYPQAIELFRRSIDLNPTHSAPVYNLARALMMNGQREEGEEQLERFRTMRKEHPLPMGGGMGDPSINPGKYGQPRSVH